VVEFEDQQGRIRCLADRGFSAAVLTGSARGPDVKNGVCPYFSLFFPNLKMANFCLDNWGRFNEKKRK